MHETSKFTHLFIFSSNFPFISLPETIKKHRQIWVISIYNYNKL